MAHRPASQSSSLSRPATATLAAEEAALACREADAQARLAELEVQEEAVTREIEDQRQALAGQPHPLLAPFVTEALGELPSLGPRQDEPTPEQTRSYEARRLAIEARKRELEANELHLAGRTEMLARARERLASAQRAAREVEAKALELSRLEAEAARRRAEAPSWPAAARAPGAEQRKTRRVRVTTAISLCADANRWSGFSADISEGGVFVATEDLPDPGTEVDLSFSLEGSKTIEARGVVRWIRAQSVHAPETTPGMGIEFLELPTEARRAIRSFAP